MATVTAAGQAELTSRNGAFLVLKPLPVWHTQVFGISREGKAAVQLKPRYHVVHDLEEVRKRDTTRFKSYLWEKSDAARAVCSMVGAAFPLRKSNTKITKACNGNLTSTRFVRISRQILAVDRRSQALDAIPDVSSISFMLRIGADTPDAG